jgi:hypothetical protein
MPININDSVKVLAPRSVDGKYLKNGAGTYTSVSDANTTIVSAYRSVGQTVFINGVEYWYKNGIADGDLIIKNNVSQVQVDWNQASSVAVDFINNKPSLATVATTGSYPDLANKPTIPSQFVPIAGTNITLSGSYPNITFNASTGSGSSLTSVTYTANQSAQVSDLDKVVFLSPSGANLTYLINPATFSNKILRIYGIPGAFIIAINPSSGTIAGVSSYQLEDQQCITVFSNGTNLFIIAQN